MLSSFLEHALPSGRRLVQGVAASLSAVVLSGCAFAPGVQFGKTLPGAASQTNPWSITAVRGTASASPATSETPPPGALIPITAELIRHQQANRPNNVSADVKKLFGIPQPYRIGPNDVINIVVWNHPELTLPPAGGPITASGADAGLSSVGNGFNVSSAGLIQFPFVGAIKVAGLTEYEVRDLLTQRLAKYLKDPQLTVRIQSYRNGRIYVDGEVRTPGLQTVNDVPMTLPEAISRAGGFMPSADRAAITLTRDGTTTVINLTQLTEQGVNPANILLRGGDLVRVLGREESKVFVLGEVTRPTTQTLRNGRLTLNEALGESGGINPVSGNPKQVFVVRAANATQPQIYHLDASTPISYALAEGFELQPRDVVYVDPVPLVRWNRVISLTLPSAQALNVTRDATTR